MAYNPLLTLERNSFCPCRSKKKFKKCCMPKLPQIVTEAEAKQYKKQMADSGLVFVTPENQEVVKAEAEYLDRMKKQREGSDEEICNAAPSEAG